MLTPNNDTMSRYDFVSQQLVQVMRTSMQVATIRFSVLLFFFSFLEIFDNGNG